METRDKSNMILYKTEFVSNEEVLKNGNKKKTLINRIREREILKFLRYIRVKSA